MYSAKIFLALETILDWDLIFLNSSQASQNSRFSSLNSVRRKALKAASPSAGTETRLYSRLAGGERPHETLSPATWQRCNLNYLPALSPGEPSGKAGSDGIASRSTAVQAIHVLNPQSSARLPAWRAEGGRLGLQQGQQRGEDPLAVPMGAGGRT